MNENTTAPPLTVEKHNRIAGMLKGKHHPATIAASCGVTEAQVEQVKRAIGMGAKPGKARR